jgi:Leucine-rich repeat (LRR) protein
MAAGAEKEITEKVLEKYVGYDWKRKKHKHLVFSGSNFFLQTLEGPDRGLLNRSLDLSRLQSLDVSENNLVDINNVMKDDKFRELKVLKARKNQITHPELRLPNLVELNLSYNQMTTMPVLDGLPNLEVLILSHNKINGTLDCLLRTRRLKRLDLAFNVLDLRPSELDRAFRGVLAQLDQLQNLRLKDNPFAAPFPEYQIFAVKSIKTLTRLDDEVISKETRQEIQHETLFSMDRSAIHLCFMFV